ncbi:MAG: transcriptional regulator of arginine metabolism [Bacillota bacterium]|nr:transcriptional regulator of arginine metabolism [Bacillota bacterium]
MKILELINAQPIETQEELAELLKKSGFEVTQATVSRDIKELRLIKVPSGQDRYCYALPPELPKGTIESRLRRIFRESVFSMDSSENLIVIKSLPGSAQAVGSAIDSLDWEDIIGTVAGDDTILVVIKRKEKVAEVLKGFEQLMG